MNERLLKDYRGFTILKTWDSETVTYLAYDKDENIFNGAKTLQLLKKSIDNYLD